MLSLAAGDWTAVLLPGQGAAMARLAWRGRDILAPLPAGADPNASPAGAFLMAPWTNRLDAGRIRVAGLDWRLPVNRPQDRTAIHGLVRDRAWTVVRQDAAMAEFALTLHAPPFHCAARLEVAVSDAGLDLALALTALGDAPQPLGIGWHPWFARPPGTRLTFGSGWRCRHDARQLPVAAAPGDGIDGTESAYLGLDTHFAGWDGAMTIRYRDAAGIRLGATGAWAANLQVYAPPMPAVLCVEPVSHLPDAPNRPVLAALGQMAVVAPGETLAGRLALSLLP